MKIQLKRSNVLENGVAKEPTAGQMEYGELAVNYNENDISIFTKDSDNNIRRVGGSVNKGSGQPDDPGTTPGDWYFDITNNILYYWDGSDWEEVQAVSKLIGGDGIEITTATTGTTFAVDLAGGDDGLEFDGGKLKATIASSSEYGVVKIGNGLDGGDDGIIKARNTITVGEDPPVTNLNQGDLWWNSGEDSGRLYVYYEDENTQQWIDASPQGGNLEQDQADQLYLSKKNDDTAVGNITFTKKIFVDEAVGIGTNNPSTTLELSSSDPRITLTDTDAPTRKTQLRNTNGNTYLSNLDSGNIIFGVPTETMRITSSGNVGIGTDSPEGNLEIANTPSPGVPTLYLSQAPSISSTSDIALTGNAAIRSEFSIRNVVNTGGFFSWSIGGDDNKAGIAGASEVMRITPAGKVGIGTDSPQGELVVRSSTPQVFLEPTSDVQNTRLNFCLTDGSISSAIQAGGKEDGLKFVTGGGEKVRFLSNGNVGIGTDTPGKRLEVKDAGAQFRATNINSDNVCTDLLMFNDGNLYVDSRNEDANGGYVIRGYNGSTRTNFVKIDPTGNVGIGDTNPSQKVVIADDGSQLRLTKTGDNTSNYFRFLH